MRRRVHQVCYCSHLFLFPTPTQFQSLLSLADMVYGVGIVCVCLVLSMWPIVLPIYQNLPIHQSIKLGERTQIHGNIFAAANILLTLPRFYLVNILPLLHYMCCFRTFNITLHMLTMRQQPPLSAPTRIYSPPAPSFMLCNHGNFRNAKIIVVSTQKMFRCHSHSS